MIVNYLWRMPDNNAQSIERLFEFIRKEFQSFDIKINDITARGRGGIKNLLKDIIYFRRMVKNNEIVHITGDVHFSAIALKTDKIIITVHDLAGNRDFPFMRKLVFNTFWIYLPFLKAKYIVAISEHTKQEIIEKMPIVAHKVIVIPNCLTMEIEKESFLKRNIKPKVLIIGTRENKNVERAIHALEGLAIDLLIIGKLNNTQLTLLIEKKIEYRNLINISESELLKVYKESDYLLFPSLYEGFGLPVLEAQAQNVIVITSNISPMKEICGENAGIFVNPSSIDSIRQEVIKALKLSTEEKLALIISGKENIIKYSPAVIAKLYYNLYERMNDVIN